VPSNPAAVPAAEAPSASAFLMAKLLSSDAGSEANAGAGPPPAAADAPAGDGAAVKPNASEEMSLSADAAELGAPNVDGGANGGELPKEEESVTAIGVCVPEEETDFYWRVDNPVGGSSNPQLTVETIATFPTEYFEEYGRRIARCESFICYALLSGFVRVIGVTSGSRALLKQHKGHVGELAFRSFADAPHEGANTLASVSVDGQVCVWQLQDNPDGGEVQVTLLCNLLLEGVRVLPPYERGDDGPHVTGRVLFHPKHPVLCFTYESYLGVVEYLEVQERTLSISPTMERGQIVDMGSCVIAKAHDRAVNSIAFTPEGGAFASCADDGHVQLWYVHARPEALLHRLRRFRAFSGESVHYLCFLRAEVLVAGGGHYRNKFALFSTINGELTMEQSIIMLDKLVPRTADVFFSQPVAVKHGDNILLLVANTRSNALFIMTTHEGKLFHTLSEFYTKQRILSFCAAFAPVDDQGTPGIQLHCIQDVGAQTQTLDLRSLAPATERPQPGSQPPEEEFRHFGDLSAAPPAAAAAGATTEAPADGGPTTVAAAPAAEPPAPSSVVAPEAAASELTPAGSNSTIHSEEGAVQQPAVATSAAATATSSVAVGGVTTTAMTPSSSGAEPALLTPTALLAATGLLTPNALLAAGSPHHSQQQHHISPASAAVTTSSHSSAASTPALVAAPAAEGAAAPSPREALEATTATILTAPLAADVVAPTPAPGPADVPASRTPSALPSASSDSSPPSAQEQHSQQQAPQQQGGTTVVIPSERPTLMHLHPHLGVVASSSAAVAAAAATASTPASAATATPPMPLTSGSAEPRVPTDDARGLERVLDSLSAELQQVERRLEAKLEAAVAASSGNHSNNVHHLTGLQQQWAQAIRAETRSAVNESLAPLQQQLLHASRAPPSSGDAASAAHATPPQLEEMLLAMNQRLTEEVPERMREGVTRAVREELKMFGDALLPLYKEMLHDGTLSATVAGQTAQAMHEALEPAVARAVGTAVEQKLRALLHEVVCLQFQQVLVPAVEKAARAMFEQMAGAMSNWLVQQDARVRETDHSLVKAEQLAQTLEQSIRLVAQEVEHVKSLRAAAPAAAPADNSAESGQGVVRAATMELELLLQNKLYEEAFNKALCLGDVQMVVWLCQQVDPADIFDSGICKLSQGVLLSLVQQLGHELGAATALKLQWIREAVLELKPDDPLVANHLKPVLGAVYAAMQAFVADAGEHASALRLCMHVLNSLLLT